MALSIRGVVTRIERWAMEDDSTLIGIAKVFLVMSVPALGVIGLMALVAWLAGGPSAESRCLASGGGWAIAGEHTEMRWHAALKMARPTRVTDYGCFDVRR